MHGDWGNVARYLFVLLWLVLSLSAGIHLFSTGFLLSRVTNTYFTNCTKLERCTDEQSVKSNHFLVSVFFAIFDSNFLFVGQMSGQAEIGCNVQRFEQIN